MNLEEATSKLETIADNPCHCNVCKHSAKLATAALVIVSPLADEVMRAANTIPNTNEFHDLEKRFRDEELTRMLGALEYLKRGRCMMLTPTKVEHTAPAIPDLPYEQGMSAALERYRKFTMQRKPRGEYKKNPRIPGTYIIK